MAMAFWISQDTLLAVKSIMHCKKLFVVRANTIQSVIRLIRLPAFYAFTFTAFIGSSLDSKVGAVEAATLDLVASSQAL